MRGLALFIIFFCLLFLVFKRPFLLTIDTQLDIEVVSS